MAITTVLFDLDGTLLPMDQDAFLNDYFTRMAAAMARQGHDPKQLINTVWLGTKAMVQNDGSMTNGERFWETAVSVMGEKIREDQPYFDAFYKEEFEPVKASCGYNPAAAEVVYGLKERGFRVVLATNPISPALATDWRIRWAGLKPEDFELYTTFENSHYCKPNLKYYEEILQKLNVRPEECLMVGNDVEEDMITRQMGMQVFLLTDCLISRHGTDINEYPHGGFEELKAFLQGVK